MHDNFSLIVEAPVFQEPKIIRTQKNKAIFRMVVQTANDINKNKRLYPLDVLMQGMRDASPRIDSRAMYCELDHPLPHPDSEINLVRQTQSLLKETSHLLIKYEFSGNTLFAEMETLNTPNGKILLGLLLDKCAVGMSMRGMAELERHSEYNKVTGPIYIISYDAVSTPSHKSAVVNFNEVNFVESVKLLKEGRQFKAKYNLNDIKETGNLICTPDGVCFLPDYFDKLIEQKIINIIKGEI